MDSLAERRSLVLAVVSARVPGLVTEAGKESACSVGNMASVTGVLTSSLSTGTSGCRGSGEEDFWTMVSSFGRSSRIGKKKPEKKDIFYSTFIVLCFYKSCMTF